MKSIFMPNPQELTLKEEIVKVTISLTKEGVNFFKERALVNRTNYQKMIRLLLDQYVAHYKGQC